MKGLIPLLLLGIIFCAEAQASEANTCPNVSEDPEVDILFPHESDCTKFYKCSHGEKYVIDCPSGLHFNAETNKCDWPESANCENGTTVGEVEDNKNNQTVTDENTCPLVVDDPEVDILFPHESDCTKFYKCSHGEKYVINCPSGLHFNAETNQCDWPESANCENGTIVGEVEVNKNNQTVTDGNTCPLVVDDPEVDILFPHESDCTKFYKCSHGEKYVINCPSGLHFNAETNRCDWPESANCENGTTVGEVEVNKNNQTVTDENTCPLVVDDPEVDILFPHESDCTKFYKCSHGEKYVINCPSGLHFNAETNQCDWPESANCENGTIVGEVEVNKNNQTVTDGNTCPLVVDDPEVDILFPHESDCTKFYKCSHGEKYVINCPSGLHFNAETNQCDWPESANCESGTTVGEVEDNKNNQTVPNENTCPLVVDDPEIDILFPHESDCTKFYKCSHGEKVLQDCPHGLNYNPEKRYCDWPQNTNCTNNGTLYQPNLLPHENDCTKFYLIFNGIPFEYSCPSGLYFNLERNICDFKINVNCKNP